MNRLGETSELSPRALQRVIEMRGQLLRSISRWYGDAAEADDILQAAYLRAIERGGSLHDEERVVAWFTRLLRNVAVDHLRRRSTEARVEDKWTRGEPDVAGPPDDVGIEICRCVLGLLDHLNPRHAEVIQLVELDGHEPAEAARRLGTTPNNVRVRLHRARAALRERLVAVCGVCAEHGCLDCFCARTQPRKPGV